VTAIRVKIRDLERQQANVVKELRETSPPAMRTSTNNGAANFETASPRSQPNGRTWKSNSAA
jgi:hypothetical protein